MVSMIYLGLQWFWETQPWFLEITYAGVTTFSQVDSVILNNIFYNFLGSCQDILQCPARYCCY